MNFPDKFILDSGEWKVFPSSPETGEKQETTFEPSCLLACPISDSKILCLNAAPDTVTYFYLPIELY